jgi:NDP-sugar pyrophosphorylase family protein
MVLCAGFGTRLRPLTHVLPKPLVPVANRPLIAYTLALLEKAGVRQVAVNLHHLGEKIQKALGDKTESGLEIAYSPEEPILGTGGGVMRMRSYLEDDRFYLFNGDVLCGVDLEALMRFHTERNAAATMVVGPLPPGAAYTPLRVDAEGWLVELKDARRRPAGETRQVMFLGVHVLEPQVFDFLPAGGFACINNQAYTAMIEKGLDIAAYFHGGFWYDLGTPAAYLAATGRSSRARSGSGGGRRLYHRRRRADIPQRGLGGREDRLGGQPGQEDCGRGASATGLIAYTSTANRS